MNELKDKVLWNDLNDNAKKNIEKMLGINGDEEFGDDHICVIYIYKGKVKVSV